MIIKLIIKLARVNDISHSSLLRNEDYKYCLTSQNGIYLEKKKRNIFKIHLCFLVTLS